MVSRSLGCPASQTPKLLQALRLIPSVELGDFAHLRAYLTRRQGAPGAPVLATAFLGELRRRHFADLNHEARLTYAASRLGAARCDVRTLLPSLAERVFLAKDSNAAATLMTAFAHSLAVDAFHNLLETLMEVFIRMGTASTTDLSTNTARSVDSQQDEEKAEAAQFVMKTAMNSLGSVVMGGPSIFTFLLQDSDAFVNFRTSFSGGATDSAKAKKKKEGRKKKRNEPSTSEEDLSDDDMEVDKGLILQVPQKEFTRKANQRTMDDLGNRQLAYVLAGLSTCMPSDLVEVGGSCESILLESASRYKKQKDKAGETQALQKAGFA
ncbi:unnamed protein product [Symbiodinium sp. CCMP2592]|nr:unnamed protein product [Symbiodinium sp. CCMP2592]